MAVALGGSAVSGSESDEASADVSRRALLELMASAAAERMPRNFCLGVGQRSDDEVFVLGDADGTMVSSLEAATSRTIIPVSKCEWAGNVVRIKSTGEEASLIAYIPMKDMFKSSVLARLQHIAGLPESEFERVLQTDQSAPKPMLQAIRNGLLGEGILSCCHRMRSYLFFFRNPSSGSREIFSKLYGAN